MDAVRPVDGPVRSESIGSGQWVPWGLWCLAFVFAAASVVGSPPADPVDALGRVGLAVGSMAVATIGSMVAVGADTPIPGWLLLAFVVPWSATWALYAIVDVLVTDGLIELAPAQTLIGVADAAAIVSMSGLFGAVLTVPDGRLPPRWGRPLAYILTAFLLAWVVHTFFLARVISDPVAYVNRASLASLEGADLSPTFARVTAALTFVGLLVVIAVGVSVVDRYRSSEPEARQQLKWVLVGALAVIFWLTLWTPRWDGAVGHTVQSVVPGLALISLAVGFGLSLFKYRLWDVDMVIRRSLVYGTLWLAIASVYAIVAAGLGLIAGSRFPITVAIGLTVAATLVFQPARRWLERLADRVVFGERESPIVALQEFGSSVGAEPRPGHVAGELAEVTRRVLGMRAVEVRVTGSEPAVAGEWGDGEARTFPIVRGDESLGSIRCLPRRGERIDASDVLVVEALASQAALTISHARLASRIVTAQEAERRRIERDIHDGVQQDLATQIGQLALARSRAGSDPDLVARLATIQAELRRTLVEIRDLAQGIHPSVLRDGGLVAAIEDRCSRVPVDVSIDAGPELNGARYDAEIEAAAYFTVAEAVTNVVKHAGASSVSITLADRDGRFRITVADDGCGFVPGRTATGSGIGGLSDRLRALGGELAIDAGPGVGTRVRAWIPLNRPGEGG